MTPRFEAEFLAAPRFFVFNFAGVMLRDGEILKVSAALFRQANSTAGTAVNRSKIRIVSGEKLLDEGSQKGETDHTRRRVQLCTHGSLKSSRSAVAFVYTGMYAAAACRFFYADRNQYDKRFSQDRSCFFAVPEMHAELFFPKGGHTMNQTDLRMMFREYPDVVNLKQLCEMLDGISEKTAYRLLRSGEIKSIIVGKRYLIPKPYILEFLASGAQNRPRKQAD